MLAGHMDGHKTSLSSMFEAQGAYNAGKIDEEKLHEWGENTCPTCASCPSISGSSEPPGQPFWHGTGSAPENTPQAAT